MYCLFVYIVCFPSYPFFSSHFQARCCKRQPYLAFLCTFCVVVHFFWLVNACFCCVRFSFFIPSQEILLHCLSPKWPVLCWVGPKTTTQLRSWLEIPLRKGGFQGSYLCMFSLHSTFFVRGQKWYGHLLPLTWKLVIVAVCTTRYYYTACLTSPSVVVAVCCCCCCSMYYKILLHSLSDKSQCSSSSVLLLLQYVLQDTTTLPVSQVPV